MAGLRLAWADTPEDYFNFIKNLENNNTQFNIHEQ